MARTDRVKRVDRVRADSYAEVGRRLLVAGRAIQETRDARHASGLVILAIHAAIAFADALCVRFGGKTPTGPDHSAGAQLLRAVLGPRLPKEMTKTLERIVSEKERFEYQGYVATLREAEGMFAKTERFAAWTERMLSSG